MDDRLEEVQIDWDPRPAVCVVMAAGGYPGKYETGHVIEGLERAEQMPDVCVFHAGTREVEHMTVTAGGRVLGVTALGDDLAAAQRRAYEAVRMIRFQNAHYRRDIAAKALAGHARAAN
ncbi:MAG TPA: phosphoribosylglycinamide synthetase C domain-containing protein [Phycisphaerae bacterium]|nr:phosphoribosylglycinamide synthetase C domain-containing protein [Phycisphaerae bacterium]HNU46275.1 phosphoribosylglycinamide synthetase C domain-containing protein [Phycisphaerae bacterium]